MTKANEQHRRQQLQKIFSRANLESLPAMSEHLKDYSLTTRILQVVNSAYYSRGTPVCTISRAVTVVGLDTLRQLATTLALFEEFVNAGSEKEEIATLFTLSLISATQSKILCETKKLNLSAEEAYLCTLLHNLGKVVVLTYLPDLYRAIEEQVRKGYSEERASSRILDGLSYSQVGQEIATFWSFSKRIISCMGTNPPPQGKSQDTFLALQNLVVLSNALTVAFFKGSELDFSDLLCKYGSSLGLDKEAALNLIARSIDVCENFSAAMREGLTRVRNGQGREITVGKDSNGRWVRLS